MLSSLKNIFKVPDLRNKILFTLLMVVLYRLGASIPVPGVDFQAVKQLQKAAETQGTLGFLNLFSGGALSQFAIFALGIMPYITASIIIQILGVVIPKLQEWQEAGRRRPAQDHPVDALPGHRHRPAAGHRRSRSCSAGAAAARSSAAARRPTWCCSPASR